MNLYLLGVLSDRDTVINNDGGLVSDAIDFLIDLIGDFVSILKTIYVYQSVDGRSVSLFDFLIVVAVMAIVITYLLNIARRPAMETTTETRTRRAEAKRKEAEEFWYSQDFTK